jgi:flavin-binding protein dodecin
MGCGRGNIFPWTQIHLNFNRERREAMAVARVTRVTSASTDGWQAAVNEGLSRASATVRNITGLEVVSHKAKVEEGKIVEYRVTMDITFILE